MIAKEARARGGYTYSLSQARFFFCDGSAVIKMVDHNGVFLSVTAKADEDVPSAFLEISHEVEERDLNEGPMTSRYQPPETAQTKEFLSGGGERDYSRVFAN